MKKFFKWLIISIISLVLIIYLIVFIGHKIIFTYPTSNVATIKPIDKNNYKLNAASHKQPKTTKEYIKVLSNQVKNYNKHINIYWPNNPLKNKYIIAKNINENNAYLISPDGIITPLSKEEFQRYGIKTLNTDGQWAPFKKGKISGAYITISSEGLNNYYNFQKYYHLGTYDQFLSYSHELFHSVTQERWADSHFGNRQRDDRESDIKARKYRMLLQQQLALAISDDKNRDKHTMDALSTYNNYKKDCRSDYNASLLFDRLEGTAFYYEVVSALYAGYPSQIKNQTDMYNAVKLIFANDNPAYHATGVSGEAYNIGGYSGILLDLLAIKRGNNPVDWKEKIEKDGNTTPMLLLEQEYKHKNYPRTRVLPTTKQYHEWMSEYDSIAPTPSRPAVVFDLLYNSLY